MSERTEVENSSEMERPRGREGERDSRGGKRKREFTQEQAEKQTAGFFISSIGELILWGIKANMGTEEAETSGEKGQRERIY